MKKIVFICLFLFPVFLFSQVDDELRYLNDQEKLFYFIETRQVSAVRDIIESGRVSADYVNKDNGLTPLILAAEVGSVPIVEYLLTKDVNLDDFIYSTHISALIYAVLYDNFLCAEKIIRAGANVDFQDAKGKTSLHYAAINGGYSYVDMLLYYESDPNIKDKLGYTALCYALESDNKDLVDLLLKNGSKIDIIVNDGSSLLHIATANGNIDFVEKNISKIKYSTNNDGFTPIDCAIVNGQSEMLSFLINRGYKPSSDINNIYTAFTLAKYSGDRKTKKLIKKNNNTKEIYYNYFRRLSLGYEVMFNSNFLLMSFNTGITEDRYGFQLETGYMCSGYHNYILFPYDENIYWQLKERRNSVYLALTKKFKMFSFFESSYLSIDARLRTSYFWGSYKGVKVRFYNNINTSPSLGLSYNFSDMASFYFMCEYFKLPMIISQQPILFDLGFKIFFNLRKNASEEKYKYIINY